MQLKLAPYQQREITYKGVTFTVRRTNHKAGGRYLAMHNGRYLVRCPASKLRVWLKHFAAELGTQTG